MSNIVLGKGRAGGRGAGCWWAGWLKSTAVLTVGDDTSHMCCSHIHHGRHDQAGAAVWPMLHPSRWPVSKTVPVCLCCVVLVCLPHEHPIAKCCIMSCHGWCCVLLLQCDNPYDTRFRPERLLLYDKHPGGIGLVAQVGGLCWGSVCVGGGGGRHTFVSLGGRGRDWKELGCRGIEFELLWRWKPMCPAYTLPSHVYTLHTSTSTPLCTPLPPTPP